MDLSKQYDDFADKFSNSVNNTLISRNEFYKIIKKENLVNTKLLDVGCGDGTDLSFYESLGAEVFGCDASEELVNIAKNKLPNSQIEVCNFENLPFENNHFDFVFSKYALQISEEIERDLNEMLRVCKKGGTLIFLVVHPIRQFIEKKGDFKDYYKRANVESVIFGGKIISSEPSHTFSEYFSKDFLEKARFMYFYEGSDFYDTSVQQIKGEYYPTFMICKFIKNN